MAVKQLDTSMANLRKWLANIERDLGTPVYFMKSEDTEITEKLQNQKVALLTLTFKRERERERERERDVVQCYFQQRISSISRM